eukprot:1531909-Amphidinium_carterae.1
MANPSSFVLPSGGREVIPPIYRESLGTLVNYGGAVSFSTSSSSVSCLSLALRWWSSSSLYWVALPFDGTVQHFAGGGKVLKIKRELSQHTKDSSTIQATGSSSSMGSAYERVHLTCRSIMKFKPSTEVSFCIPSSLVGVSHIKTLIAKAKRIAKDRIQIWLAGEVAQHFDWILFEDNVATVQYSTLPILAGRERRTRRKRRANDDSDLSTDELRHIFELEDMRPGDLVTVNESPLDGAPGVLTSIPGHCTDTSMEWKSFISFRDTVLGVGFPSSSIDPYVVHDEILADFLHDGGASVPESWFHRYVIQSESEEPSEDSHQLRLENDLGSLDSEVIPSVEALASRSLPSSLSSDMGYNPESRGTSREVSLPCSMVSDLDGTLGYTCGEDGILRPHDFLVLPPPLLVLPPQDLPLSPPIISHMSYGNLDTIGDLWSSINSSLMVDFPLSPRSDLGGQIGYAVDNEGNWHVFDLDPFNQDPGQLTVARLMASGFATSLLDHYHHTGGMITISVDHGLLSFVDFIDHRTPLGEWKKACDLTERDLYWHGAKLDPSITLERRSATSISVTLVPRMWHEGEQPVIRPFQQCRESTVWSLAEISFWHPHRQPLSQYQWAGQSVGYVPNENPIALAQRLWLEELLERLHYASRILEQWRLSQMSRKRALPQPKVVCSSSSGELDHPSPSQPGGSHQPPDHPKRKKTALLSQPTATGSGTDYSVLAPKISDPVCTPIEPWEIEEMADSGFINREPECTGPPTHSGGVSDATVRGRLTSKASAAGMKNAGELIGLLWSFHATVLHATGGNPSAVKSVLMALAKKDGILTDSSEDPLQSQDPWAAMRGKPSSSSSKPPAQQGIDRFENLQLHSALQLKDGTQLT